MHDLIKAWARACVTAGRFLIRPSFTRGWPLLILLHLALTPALAAIEFAAVTLPDATPGHPAGAVDLNDQGQVLCTGILENGTTHTFIYENGALTDLGDLGAVPGTRAVIGVAINNTGHVLGTAWDQQTQPFPFLWHDGAFEPLTAPLFAGAEDVYVVDLNDSLQAVGYLNDGTGFVWKDGVALDLGFVHGGPYTGGTIPEAINNQGQIVGYASVAPPDLIHPFLWQNGTLTDLGNLGGIRWAYAYGINEPGSIVGSYSYNVNGIDGRDTAYLWQGGVVTDLGVLECGDYCRSMAFDINDQGEVVGHSEDGGAFLWRNGTMENLNSLVELPPGRILWDARKINNRGDILCDGFLLTAGGILHPSPGRLVVSGAPDTIRWNAPDGLGLLEVQLNTRALAAPDDYRTLGVVPAADGQFAYLPPDTIVTTQCRVRLVSLSSPDTIRSGIFRMKPLTITKLDALGNYVPFRLGRDNWSQRNEATSWWPRSWWQGEFDYEDGTDPITHAPYPSFPDPNALAFYTAADSVFPDWPLFVATFGEGQCYWNKGDAVYSPFAALSWMSLREPWGGSCSGLAYSALMNFFHPQYMRTRFPQLSAHSELPDDNPAANDIRLIPNQLQNAQVGAAQLAIRTEASRMTPRQTIRALETAFAADVSTPLSPLSLQNQEAGGGSHSVVPYLLRFEPPEGGSADSTWYVFVYDPIEGDSASYQVRVRTSPANTAGIWNAVVDDEFWGGDGKGLFLLAAADSAYGESVLFPSLPGGRPLADGPAAALSGSLAALSDPAAVRSGPPALTVFTSAAGLMEVTSATEAGVAGFVDGHLVDSLPGCTPILLGTGRGGAPEGYALDPIAPLYTYRFDLGSGADGSRSLGAFRADAAVSYQREAGTSGLTDRVRVDGAIDGGGGGDSKDGIPILQLGISAMGDSSGTKTVTLTTIGRETDHEKVWVVRELHLAAGDSVHVGRVDSEVLRVVNGGGTAQACVIGLERASATGDPQFRASGVSLPAGAAMNIVANWNDLAGDSVAVQVDLGNDGTVDQTIFVQNETGEPATGVGGDPADREFAFSVRRSGVAAAEFQLLASLSRASDVRLRVYDVRGRQVATVAAGRHAAGNLALDWNGRDDRQRRLGSGVYFLRFEARPVDGTGGDQATRKVVLVR